MGIVLRQGHLKMIIFNDRHTHMTLSMKEFSLKHRSTPSYTADSVCIPAHDSTVFVQCIWRTAWGIFLSINQYLSCYCHYVLSHYQAIVVSYWFLIAGVCLLIYSAFTNRDNYVYRCGRLLQLSKQSLDCSYGTSLCIICHCFMSALCLCVLCSLQLIYKFCFLMFYIHVPRHVSHLV